MKINTAALEDRDIAGCIVRIQQQRRHRQLRFGFIVYIRYRAGINPAFFAHAVTHIFGPQRIIEAQNRRFAAEQCRSPGIIRIHKSCPIVIGPHVHLPPEIIRSKRDLRTVAAIDRNGVIASPRIGFINRVSFALFDGRIFAQIRSADNNAGPRRLKDRCTATTNLHCQVAVFARIDRNCHILIRAFDLRQGTLSRTNRQGGE